MNTINVSNPTINNILMLLNTRGNNPDKPKKRPTYDEVFNKISKRTQNLKSTKQPLNNILTNDQLFRFYIQDTQPLLQKSNDKFNEGANTNLIQALTASKTSQNTTYGVADIGNTNEPSNVAQSTDYVDNPTIDLSNSNGMSEAQIGYNNTLKGLEFFNGLNMEANNNVDTGTFINMMLMRDVLSNEWKSFGYNFFNDLYNRGTLEDVITELYDIMTKAMTQDEETYKSIRGTLFNIMRLDVEGLSKGEIEDAIFKYIQEPPPNHAGSEIKFQQEITQYQASADKTPFKILQEVLKYYKQQIDGTEETPTPEVGGVASPPLKDPSRFPPRPQELKNPATFPPRTDEDIIKAQAGQVIRGMIDGLFSDEATANETDTEPFAGFESFDFTPMRVSELLLKVPSFMDYDTLPENIKPFYQKPEPRSEPPRITNIPYIPPPQISEDRESIVQPRGRGRPAGSRNKPRRGEAEMRTLILDEVRGDIQRDLPINTELKISDDDLEDLINSIFS